MTGGDWLKEMNLPVPGDMGWTAGRLEAERPFGHQGFQASSALVTRLSGEEFSYLREGSPAFSGLPDDTGVTSDEQTLEPCHSYVEVCVSPTSAGLYLSLLATPDFYLCAQGANPTFTESQRSPLCPDWLLIVFTWRSVWFLVSPKTG